MSKKKARIILILLAASLVLLLYTAFIGWGPTGTGAMKNIKLGLDLEGGVSVTYQAKEDNPSAEDMADTVYKLQKRVDAISTEAHVYQEGRTGSTSRSPASPTQRKFSPSLESLAL